jgi:hypothetical protein
LLSLLLLLLRFDVMSSVKQTKEFSSDVRAFYVLSHFEIVFDDLAMVAGRERLYAVMSSHLERNWRALRSFSHMSYSLSSCVRPSCSTVEWVTDLITFHKKRERNLFPLFETSERARGVMNEEWSNNIDEIEMEYAGSLSLHISSFVEGE